MTDALSLASALEDLLERQTEWRVGKAAARTYLRKFSSEAAARQWAAEQQQPGTVYKHEQRLANADLLGQAAELLRAQHAMLHRRAAAARKRETRATMTVALT